MPAATVARKAAARAVARKVAETTGSFVLSAAVTAARSRTVRRIVVAQVGLAVVLALAVPFLILEISTSSPAGAGDDDQAVARATQIPAVARAAYVQASAHARLLVPGCTLRASDLAGIFSVASNHGDGRLNASGTAEPPLMGSVDEAGQRVGPGQFTLADWIDSRLDGNGDGVADPQNIHDAALTTAVIRCRAAPDGTDRAPEARG